MQSLNRSRCNRRPPLDSVEGCPTRMKIWKSLRSSLAKRFVSMQRSMMAVANCCSQDSRVKSQEVGNTHSPYLSCNTNRRICWRRNYGDIFDLNVRAKEFQPIASSRRKLTGHVIKVSVDMEIKNGVSCAFDRDRGKLIKERRKELILEHIVSSCALLIITYSHVHNTSTCAYISARRVILFIGRAW